jgi:hypothetical protein
MVYADFYSSWLDRLPFVLLFGIATSAESFEERLAGNSLRYLDGQKFDVTQSDEIIEKLFRATIAGTDARLHVGANLCRRMLDRQKDHVQNTQDFCDGLKYAYMSHFYASVPSVFLKHDVAFEQVSADAFEAVRTLPSFRHWVENMLEGGQVQDVRGILEEGSRCFCVHVPNLLSIPQLLTTSTCAFPASSAFIPCLGYSWYLFILLLISRVKPCGSPGESTGGLNRHQPVDSRFVQLYSTSSLHLTEGLQYGRQDRRTGTGRRCVYYAPEERRRHQQAVSTRANARRKRTHEEPLQKILVVW